MFRVNKRNTETRREICLKITIKTPEQCQIFLKLTIKIPERLCSSVSIVNVEQINAGWD